MLYVVVLLHHSMYSVIDLMSDEMAGAYTKNSITGMRPNCQAQTTGAGILKPAEL